VTAAAGPVVVLVGPPGSGKTSVGRALARRLGRRLRDTDADIEAAAGRPIPDIFVTDGEPVFRAMERAAVATALIEHDGVLALGGGSILAEQTRTLLKQHTVVFLGLTMPTGVKRTGLASNRPLLTGVNPRATYKALLDARLPLYEEVATIAVQTDALSIDEVADVIIDKLELGVDQ
jgi:shikimate kinase